MTQEKESHKSERIFNLEKNIEQLKKERDRYDYLMFVKSSILDRVKNVSKFDKDLSLRAINQLVNRMDDKSYEIVSQECDDKNDAYYLYCRDDEHFIRIAYCNKLADEIDYSKNTLSFQDNVSSGFCSIDIEEYLYILDFMHDVIDYKLLKFDCMVSEEELNQLVYQFVCKYKYTRGCYGKKYKKTITY